MNEQLMIILSKWWNWFCKTCFVLGLGVFAVVLVEPQVIKNLIVLESTGNLICKGQEGDPDMGQKAIDSMDQEQRPRRNKR